MEINWFSSNFLHSASHHIGKVKLWGYKYSLLVKFIFYVDNPIYVQDGVVPFDKALIMSDVAERKNWV